MTRSNKKWNDKIIENKGSCVACQPIVDMLNDWNEERYEMLELLNLVLISDACPICGNQGYYTEGTTDHPVMVQCEFCHCEPKSIFNTNEKIKELLKIK